MRRFYSRLPNPLPYTGSDLALERRRADTDTPGVNFIKERVNGFTWERLEITSVQGEKEIGRPKGNYDTLTTMDMNMLDSGEIEDAAQEIAKELFRLCEINRIKPERILVIGLGNKELTPDSLGDKSVRLVNPTLHIKDIDIDMFSALECMEIITIVPGTVSQSGIEAAEIIMALCKTKHPDLVIAIDSLCTRSKHRLGRSIQISDTGIVPGAGVGRARIGITEKTVDAPVISIGIPTVVNSSAFEENLDDDFKKLKTQKYSDDALLVSPKDIDLIVENGAKIIALAINQAFGIDL